MFEVKFAICLGNFKVKEVKFEFIMKKKCFVNHEEKFWVWVTPLVGRHVVNEPKVGYHVVNELEIS